MSTSLSRQLDRLRTSHPLADPESTSSVGKELLEGHELSERQLLLAAKEAFSHIRKMPMYLSAKLFPIDNSSTEGEEAVEWMEEALVVISSSLLMPQAQILLQFMVTKHKVHVLMPDLLMFVAMAHLQFKIANKIILTIANQHPRPSWVSPFMSLCHPATERGLVRHLSSDRGFFKLFSDLMQRVIKSHQRVLKKDTDYDDYDNDEDKRIDTLAFFYATMMCKVIVNTHVVNEAQCFSLTSVITIGLKSTVKELLAMAAIIMAYLLPKVTFRAKMNRRLVKLIEQMDNNISVESELKLKLALVLIRHQRLDKELKSRLSAFVLRDKETLRALMLSQSKSNDFKTRLSETLAIMMDEKCDEESNDYSKERLETQTEVIECLYEVLKNNELVKPINSLGKIIKTATSMTTWLKQRDETNDQEEKENNNDEVEMIDDGSSLLLRCASSTRKLLSLLRERFPVETALHTATVATQMEDFIMEQDGHGNLLTSEQIRVKRIILDNELISSLSDIRLSAELDRYRVKELNRMAKSNSSQMQDVFSTVDVTFLSHHLQDRLVPIVMHALNLFSKSPKVLAPLVKVAGSEEFVTLITTNSPNESTSTKSLLEYTLLSLLVGASANWSRVVTALKETWFIENNKESALAQIARGLSDKTSQGTHVWQVISKRMKVKNVLEMAKIVLTNPICFRNSTLVTLLTLLISKAFRTKTVKNEDRIQMLRELLKFINLLRAMNVSSDLSICESNDDDDDDLIALLTYSRQQRSLPLKAVEKALDKGLNLSLNEDIIREVLKTVAGIRKTSSHHIQSLATKCETLFIAQTEKRPDLLLDLLMDEDDDIALIALKRLRAQYSDDNTMKMSTTTLLKVLVSMNRKKRKVRKETLNLLKNCKREENHLDSFIDHLIKYKDELMADKENLSSVMKEYDELDVLPAVLKLCLDNKRLFVALSFLYRHMKNLSMDNVNDLVDMFITALNEENDNVNKAVLSTMSSFFQPFILANLENSTKCFELIESILMYCKNDKLVSDTLASLASSSSKSTSKLLNLLVDTVQIEERSGDLIFRTKEAVLRLRPSGKMILDKLVNVWGKETFAATEWEKSKQYGSGFKRRYGKIVDTDDNVDKKWKQTTFLLEAVLLLQSSSSSKRSMSVLLKPLFILLKKALAANELFDFSYAMDLLLSSLQLILEEQEELEEEQEVGLTQVTDLLVQCMKECSAPSTKNSALMVLALATSSCQPEAEVMHNMLPIFTFVGNHFLQLDTKNSFDIACRAIDILVPSLKNCSKKKKGRESNDVKEKCLSILTTFCDASHDLNALRFRSFLQRLVVALGEFDYFWVATLKLLDKNCGNRNNLDENKLKRTRKERMQQLLNLYSAFSAKAQVEAVLQMSVNLKHDSNNLRRTIGLNPISKEESAIIRRDFGLLKVQMLDFISNLLKSDTFNEQVVKSVEDIRPQLTLLLEAAIVNVASINEKNTEDAMETDDESSTRASMRLLRALRVESERFLECVLASAIPSEYFPEAVAKLLKDNSSSQEVITRKTLEVIIVRLADKEGNLDTNDKCPTEESSNDIFSESNVNSFLRAIAPLANLTHSTTSIATKQLALLALRSLAQTCLRFNPLCAETKTTLIEVLTDISHRAQMKTLTEYSADNRLKATSLLCYSELFNVIGAKAVPHLSFFVKLLVVVMREERLADQPVLMNSVILSVQRVAERFAGFLHPFFTDLIVLSCKLKSTNKATQTRLKHMWKALAVAVPHHFLLNMAENCYQLLRENRQNRDALVIFFNVIRDNILTLNRTQANVVASVYVEFFTKALAFRQEGIEEENDDHADADDRQMTTTVESSVIEAFLALGLKLALEEFKPLFYRVFLLKDMEEDNVEQAMASNTTAFHLALVVASRLRSLFGFVFESLVSQATSLLSKINVANTNVEFKRLDNLLSFVLDTLTEVFRYADIESVMGTSYEEHVNAILTIYELNVHNQHDFNALLLKVEKCLVQLATATEDDTQWKYLNYQSLLCLRRDSSTVRVRLLALVKSYVELKGDEYMAVLGDAAPILNEMLDDDDELIEKEAKNLIDHMQHTFGQSVQSYFEM